MSCVVCVPAAGRGACGDKQVHRQLLISAPVVVWAAACSVYCGLRHPTVTQDLLIKTNSKTDNHEAARRRRRRIDVEGGRPRRRRAPDDGAPGRAGGMLSLIGSTFAVAAFPDPTFPVCDASIMHKDESEARSAHDRCA